MPTRQTRDSHGARPPARRRVKRRRPSEDRTSAFLDTIRQFVTWRVALFACLLIVGFCLYSLCTLVVTRNELEGRYNSTQAALDSLKAESARLELELESLDTDEAIEALARRELGWVKPGETAAVIASSDAASQPRPSAPKPAAKQSNWEQWWNVFFGQ